jgi:hypothetical protein
MQCLQLKPRSLYIIRQLICFHLGHPVTVKAIKRVLSSRTVFLNRRALASIILGPHLIKNNLPGRGLTKVENHCSRILRHVACYGIKRRDIPGDALFTATLNLTKPRSNKLLHLIKIKCNIKYKMLSLWLINTPWRHMGEWRCSTTIIELATRWQ